MDVKVLSESNHEELEHKLSELIKAGWTPIWGTYQVSHSLTNHGSDEMKSTIYSIILKKGYMNLFY